MAPRVLIADKLSPAAVDIFRARGVEADVKTGLTKDELLKIIDQYDGLAVRSATKADKDVIAAATNLKVIGRAGIGVDNVDIPAATAKGIVVMTPRSATSITHAGTPSHDFAWPSICRPAVRPRRLVGGVTASWGSG